MLHQLRDDVDRLLKRAHSIQLNEFAVSQLLHDLCFGQEVLRIHRARLQRLDGHRRRVVPQTLPDIAKLARAEFLDEAQRVSVDFPLVTCAMRQAVGHRLLNLKTESAEKDD